MLEGPNPKTFNFDAVKGEDSTQEELFSQVGKKVVETSIQGYNGTVFAYGQTGSGKTFTMNGPGEGSAEAVHNLRGIMPRCFEHLFNMTSRETKKGTQVHVYLISLCLFFSPPLPPLPPLPPSLGLFLGGFFGGGSPASDLRF